MKRKIICTVFTLVCAAICAFGFSACDSKKSPPSDKGTNGLEYRLVENDRAYWVVGIGTATETDIVIPSKYNGKSVTGIGPQAFSGCRNLTSITIPHSVDTIHVGAFLDCSGLTSITIPKSVKTIGISAFGGCENLTDITISDGVKSIGSYAFQSCDSLTSITIPDSVTDMGERIFRDYGHVTAYCEASSKPSGWDDEWNVQNYGGNDAPCPVVWNCKNNDKDENGYMYAILDGIRYALKDGTASVVEQPRNLSGAVTIPASVTYKKEIYRVTSIGHPVSSSGGFSSCMNLTSVTIPNSVTSIGKRAFRECTKLTSITFQGTMAQWKAIEKATSSYSEWDLSTGDYTVICTDGTLTKSEARK